VLSSISAFCACIESAAAAMIGLVKVVMTEPISMI
jgi:hypothetical protein